MVREASITQEQVNAIAEGMRAGGATPTVRAVRERLGMGSQATVMRMVNTWKAGQVRAAETPITLPVALQRALVDYLAQAVAEGKATLAADLAELQQVNADLATESERQTAVIERGEDALEAMQSERDALAGRLVQLEQDLALARGEAEQERAAASIVQTNLAKAQLRLEALPRLEADLTAARADTDRERTGRTAAEQVAAVAEAKLAGEVRARERVEVELANEVVRANKAGEQVAAGARRVEELLGQLAAARLDQVRTEKARKAVGNMLGTALRGRVSGAARKPLKRGESPAGDDGKGK